MTCIGTWQSVPGASATSWAVKMHKNENWVSGVSIQKVHGCPTSLLCLWVLNWNRARITSGIVCWNYCASPFSCNRNSTKSGYITVIFPNSTVFLKNTTLKHKQHCCSCYFYYYYYCCCKYSTLNTLSNHFSKRNLQQSEVVWAGLIWALHTTERASENSW